MNKFVVTNRDKNLLKFIMESKVTSRDQLHRNFFNNTKTVRALNSRLNKLMLAGYINRTGIQTENGYLFCYAITILGLEIIKEHIGFDILKSPQRSEKQLHDLALVDIRDILSKREAVSYYLTENMLQSLDIGIENINFQPFIESNSDAALVLKISDKKYMLALEYENSVQSSAKYLRKLRSIYDSEMPAVLYVCNSLGLVEKMQGIEKRVIEELNCKPKGYYSTLDVLQSSKENIYFKNILGQTLSIK